MEMIDFNAKKGFLCDMDGVIYHGNHILPGAAEFIHWLQDTHKEYLFLTNNSGMTPRELQERRVQEHMLEKVVSGLLPEFQDHARANFYEQQVKQVANRHETAPPQSELSFER